VKNNRRSREIVAIRKDMMTLPKRYRQADESEKVGIAELGTGQREKLKFLRRAEKSRKKTKDRVKKRAMFTSNPYQFTPRLLGSKGLERLNSEMGEVETTYEGHIVIPRGRKN